MRIVIHDDTGDDVLVDGFEREDTSDYAVGPIGDVTFSDETSIQVARRLRGPAATIYHRGGLVAKCEFSALRQFADAMLAKLWLAEHIVNVRRSHTLTMTDGTTSIALTGALGPIRYEPRGVELLLHYTFTFSEVA
jgi:hypothetical protein